MFEKINAKLEVPVEEICQPTQCRSWYFAAANPKVVASRGLRFKAMRSLEKLGMFVTQSNPEPVDRPGL